MRVQVIDRRKLAIYIELRELERRGGDDGSALAQIAREQFSKLDGSGEVGELSLVAYASVGGLLVFAERGGQAVERAVCAFSSLADASSAARLLRPPAPLSSLIFCEGRWYVELCGGRPELETAAAALCECGERSQATAAWLREHGRVIAARRALELLQNL